MATPTINVDVWSDLVCPWCHIGKRRFETALAAFEHRDSVRVRWRSFELDPHGSAEPGLTLPERHRRDVAGTAEQARQNLQRVTDLAAESGLTYRLDIARPVNSFDAHRLMHYADRAGHGEAVREALMRAYTAEGEVLSDIETLVRIAAANGLDATDTRALLKSTAFTDEVREDENLARTLGVSGVPTFVFANRYAISGAQSVEAFTRLLHQSWQETPAG
ncbi:DsbA family oxidoreductase [Nonomuraea wenchangensis]